MHKRPFFFLISLPFVFFAFLGCATLRRASSVNEVPALHVKFIAADAIERGDFDLNTWNELKRTLHAELHRLGDEIFAQALSQESDEVRVSVVNCMGFLQPAQYDRYPKTLHVLSAAPKI